MKFIRWLREYLDRESGNGKARESFWDDPNGGSTTDLGRNSIEQYCFYSILQANLDWRPTDEPVGVGW